MSAPYAEASALKVGDALPSFETEPLSRLTLALYCGASGDHNPIHVDSDFARAAGVPDVFVHGMLSMAWLGRLMTNWVPQSALRELSVRFVAITRVGERITCAGRVTGWQEHAGERCARVEITTTNQHGEPRLSGEALVALGRHGSNDPIK
ncbi:MaoC family dehydratase [Paraburkholderia antibiotica]|uniref:MaoC family dehydratase n=1 Tax=Paraburkholderia antibiotica TaxID=2728839 RepID=A0A7X9X7Z9_9BURK|nr:MaoC family dehydratase [Paraburkholderia antibiotica]NML32749.1 MaoC family dehydratase [Paraburkholderia antibiotica]